MNVPSSKPFNLFISVGEESADLHASRVCEELKSQRPDMNLFGFGGSEMEKAGVKILYPLPELALIGFVEVVKHLPQVRKIEQSALKIWEEQKPDAVVFVDFPGLHLRLARSAHERGIPVIYYIAPQVWAWREKRVERMRKTIDRLLVIFPFEEPFFEARGLSAKYVGHPLAERIPQVDTNPTPTDPPSEEDLASPLIGLLPGSRKNELRHTLPCMIRAAHGLRQQLPSARFLLPLASSLSITTLQRFSVPPWIEVCRDPDYQRRREITFAWTCSGTATVENALLGVPMAVVFRTGPINMFLGRRLVRVPYIGMVNLIARKGICPEFIQEQFQPETLTRYTMELLSNPARYREMKEDLKKVREQIGDHPAAKETAEEILNFLTHRLEGDLGRREKDYLG